MSKEKIDEIEKKKKELEAELDRIQNELDYSLDEVRSDVSSKLKPVEFIRKYPLPVVGVSVLAGFLAGHRKKNREVFRSSSSGGSGFSSALWTEFKRLVTRKAVTFATDYADSFLRKKSDKTSTVNNGVANK